MSHALYFGQVVIGPAGSGKVLINFLTHIKSTYCQYLQEHAEIFGRNFLVVNLDPAAEAFKYRCDVGKFHSAMMNFRHPRSCYS
jgi:GPN-loop GTPase